MTSYKNLQRKFIKSKEKIDLGYLVKKIKSSIDKIIKINSNKKFGKKFAIDLILAW